MRNGSWPAIELTYKNRAIKDAQITQLFAPNTFNDVQLKEHGVAFEKAVDMAPFFDLFVRGGYLHIEREGVVEFLPSSVEEIDQLSFNLSASRFIGPNKATLEAVYISQKINPEIPRPPNRERTIAAASASCLLQQQAGFRHRFDNRGTELTAGIVSDEELFDQTMVTKKNYFIGAAWKGVALINGLNAFDISVRPTLFTSTVDGDASQDNSQLRTSFNMARSKSKCNI